MVWMSAIFASCVVAFARSMVMVSPSRTMAGSCETRLSYSVFQFLPWSFLQTSLSCSK